MTERLTHASTQQNLAEKGGQAYADKNGVAIFPHLAVVDPFSQEILVKKEVFSLENLAIAMAAAVLDLEQEESRTLKKLSSKTSSDQWNVPVINVICTQDTGKKPLLVVTLAGSCALQPPYFVRRLDRILCDDQVVSTIKGRLDIQVGLHACVEKSVAGITLMRKNMLLAVPST